MDPALLIGLYTLMIFLLLVALPVVIIIKIIGYVARTTRRGITKINR